MKFVVIWISETKSGFATYFTEQAAQKFAEDLRTLGLTVVVRRRDLLDSGSVQQNAAQF